jgi:hypothetical protein
MQSINVTDNNNLVIKFTNPVTVNGTLNTDDIEVRI